MLRIIKNKNIVQSTFQLRYLSTDYLPGRKGYAPGFEAPEGTRETPKVNPKRRDIKLSLTSHLENNESKKSDILTESPKKLYRRELKHTRHQYAHELLEKEGQKQMRLAERIELGEKKAKLIQASLEEEKRKQEEHTREIVNMLSLDKIQQQVQKERNEKRIQNRLAFEEMHRNERHKQLSKLYSKVDSFVTLDNLDAKVNAVLSPEGKSFHEGLDDLMHNINTVQTEIEHRKEQIKEVMGL
ncbi:uncharacterized protein BX663DRAFT_518107 [Cokeromyces recurvatus]|uniref:uncharacterized protein n=1 Tax=Cokeromyces recurvatus TaxID=90255 RepID=UPI0022209F83|nr:uncharacterized protein BX663DRAFT_518107 [Cokeromyces recurvatus]KAI7900276.1 hypothetical protein BX663DRAFT_518107 [Cokeromyces recurvatus]